MRLLHSTITCSPRSLTLIVCYNDFITPLFHSLFTDRSNTALQQYRVCCTIKGIIILIKGVMWQIYRKSSPSLAAKEGFSRERH